MLYMWTSSPLYAVRYKKHDPQKKKENHRSSRLVQLTESYCSLKNEWYKSHLRLFYKWMNEHIYSLPLFGLRKGKDYYNNHSKFPSIYSPIFYSILLTTVSSHRHNWRTKNEWVRQTSLHLIISFPFSPHTTVPVYHDGPVQIGSGGMVARNSGPIERKCSHFQNSKEFPSKNPIFGCKLKKITAYKVWSGLPWWHRW